MTRQQIIARLHSTARSEQAWSAVRGLGYASIVVSSVVLVFLLTEAILNGSMQVRTVLWWTMIAAALGAFGYWVVPGLLRMFGLLPLESPTETSLRVGEAYEDVGDMLCNVLQLTEEGAGTSELAAAAFTSVAHTVENKDFGVIIDRRRPRFAALVGLASIVGLVGITALTPGILGAAWARIVNHNVSYVPPAPFKLTISPKKTSVMRGTATQIEVTATGVAPAEITVHIREAGSDRYQPFVIRRDTGSTYHYQLPGLAQTVQFYAEAAWLEDGVRTDTGMISVIDRPLVRTLTGRVVPPSYTRMPPTDISEQQADVTALTGSHVDVSIVANKDLAEARLVIISSAGDSSAVDTSIVSLEARGTLAKGRFTVSRTGTYHIELRDKNGQVNADPVKYGIVALTDAYPMISLLEPTQNVELDKEALVPIVASIADDYGFSRLRLYYRLTASRYAEPEKNFRSFDIPITGEGAVLDVPYIWNMAKVDITPEDAYEFYLEVADNDQFGGPKTARTSTLTVRMPSLDEVFAESDKTQENAQRELKNLAKEAEEVKREAEQLQRELQKQQSQQKQEASWSEKKKAEELMQRQEELQKRMDQVVQKMEEMTENLQQNQAISPETLKKYQELQKLMKEVKSPELARMQEQLKKAMDQVSPEELQKMMKEFKFNEEEFKKNLERQLNLLKRMQAEQKVDELQKRAEELARKQDELQQRTEQSNPNNKEENKKLAEEQRRLEEDLKRLAEEAKELEKLMKEVGQDMPQEKMEQAQKDLDPQGTQEKMDQASDQMEKGEKQEASQKQQQASQNLQRFAQQMKNMKREMKRNSQKEAMRHMQKGINDLLDVSKQQEELREQMKNMDPNSSQYPQMAQKQQKLQESMQNIANNMMQLGQKSTSVSPEMAQDLGDALQGMKDAMQSLSDRNGSKAQQSQSGAMSSMNSAASRMSESLASMMQGEGAGQGGQGQTPGQGEGRGMSPFQRLQQLADQQKSIGEGMNRVGQGGQQMDEKQRGELGRLAGQQGRALKALQELEQERKKIVGDKKQLGDLNQIAQDMQEVMSDMQSGNITPETRQRQDRILSRLLDASRSMNDRDYEKSRESNSGQDVTRRSPGAIDLPEQQRQSMRTMMQQLRQGYSKDYENLIRQYFEALQRQRLSPSAKP